MTMTSGFRRTLISTALLAALMAGCSSENPDTLVSSGKEYLAKNDPKAAIIQLKNALQQNPNLAEARFLLGKALLETGEPAGAEVELRKAYELKHAPDQTAPLLARALLMTGQTKKLIDEFSKVELSPGEPSAALKTILSAAFQVQGNADAAQKNLDAALSSKPDYPPAQLATARLKAASQDLAGAMKIVDSILAASANNHDALLLKGSISAAQGDQQAALTHYQKAIAAKPDFIQAHTALISTLILQGKKEEAQTQLDALKKVAPKHAQTIYLDAQMAYQKQDYKAARELAQQLLKIAPNNPNTLQLAGATESQLGSFVQAETFLTKALQLNPDLPMARRVLVANYLRTGQATKALSTLTPILDRIDKEPALLSLAGQTFLQNGDAKKAEQYFSKAAQLDPNDPAKKTSLALSHLAQGDMNAGLLELEKISASDKGISADLALISTHLRRNELDKALKAIDTLAQKQPNDPATYNLRARTLLAKGDQAGARSNFDKSLSLNPAYMPAATSLAALDMADKKPDDARKRFENVLAADAKNVSAFLALAELKNNQGGKPDEVTALINKAIDANPTDSTPRLALIEYYLRTNDPKKALGASQSALAALPDKPELLDAAGRAQVIAGDTNQALTTYGKLANLQPGMPIVHLRLADLHRLSKNNDEASKSLRRALEIKPDLLDAQKALVVLALEAKKGQEAVSIAREVQKQRPKEAVGYALEADIRSAQQDSNQALAVLRNGLKVTGSNELAIKLHSTLLQSGENGEAEKLSSTWLKDHPKDITFRSHLGDVATLRKDYGAAAQHYKSALDIQPANPLLLNNLAWILGQQKSPKALEYAEKANQIAPNQPAFMDTKAILLADQGKEQQAIELLRKALTLSPNAYGIQLNLAKTLIQAGKKDEARTELDALSKLGDKYSEQAEVAQLRKQL